MNPKAVPRRDRCYLVGKRASALTQQQAAVAWELMSDRLQHDLSEYDIPKFNDLLQAVRNATIKARASTP